MIPFIAFTLRVVLIVLLFQFDFSELEGRKLRFRTPNDRGRVGKIRKVGEEKKVVEFCEAEDRRLAIVMNSIGSSHG